MFTDLFDQDSEFDVGHIRLAREADLIVLVGSNTAWCHPVVYQRIMAARAKRGVEG